MIPQPKLSICPAWLPPLLDPKTITTADVKRIERQKIGAEREPSVIVVENLEKSAMGHIGRAPTISTLKETSKKWEWSAHCHLPASTQRMGKCPKHSTGLPHGGPAGDVVSIWTDRYIAAAAFCEARSRDLCPTRTRKGVSSAQLHSLTSMCPHAPVFTSSPKPQRIL